VLDSLWVTESTSYTSDWVKITVTMSGTAATTSFLVPTGSSYVNNLPDPTVGGYQIYPSGWRSKNVDTTSTDPSNIKFHKVNKKYIDDN
jgi:hypothetical protein